MLREDDLDFRDFDDFGYRLSRKFRYNDEKVQFVFTSEAEYGYEIELTTYLDLAWRIKPGTYSSYALDPEEYYDQYELIAWEVSRVEDEFGDKVDPKDLLTKEEFERYTADLGEFLDNYL